jgi:tyrosyl-tRNA synthetase
MDWPEERVRELEIELEADRAHPKQVKADLARAIVTQYHSEPAATGAEAEFERVFAARELPTDILEVPVDPEMAPGGKIEPIKLVRHCGFAASNGEARRLIEQGGVSLNGATVTDPKAKLAVLDRDVLRVGKRRFARLRLGES